MVSDQDNGKNKKIMVLLILVASATCLFFTFYSQISSLAKNINETQIILRSLLLSLFLTIIVPLLIYILPGNVICNDSYLMIWRGFLLVISVKIIDITSVGIDMQKNKYYLSICYFRGSNRYVKIQVKEKTLRVLLDCFNRHGIIVKDECM